ncbi:MAG: dTDP-4-dehydrorhamnose reductase [Lachnospiraceae bacterium]|nr:dTDP-4-dehydrorhamnose reductase [Lachnospiraceae bacterium]
MKVVVTGVRGQLGYDVMNELAGRGYEGLGTDILPLDEKDGGTLHGHPYAQLDITDREAVHALIRAYKPDAVVHCAAWTNVDGAEDPANQDKVYAVNALGTRNIAEAAEAAGAKMLYLSTDYVFSGEGTEPWDPDCTEYRPLNYYGKTKLEGEKAVRDLVSRFFIVRIAWVFGVNGSNFVKTMLRLGQTHDTLRVVNDQIGTPTFTYDLARLLVDMIETTEYGYYHATNEGGYISWYTFACEIFKQAGLSVHVIPVTTAEYGVSKASRPFNSRLDKEKLTRTGFVRLPVWSDALERYLKMISVR